jgi:flagellar basal body-associated protein FliL
MKKAAEWFEVVIDNVHQSKHWSTVFLTVLLVLFIGAGSLYMLLHTTG